MTQAKTRTCPECGGLGTVPIKPLECGKRIIVGEDTEWEAHDQCHLPAVPGHDRHIGSLLTWSDNEFETSVKSL